MKKFNEWLSIKENYDNTVICPRCGTEYSTQLVQSGDGCPMCGHGEYDKRPRVTAKDYKLMAIWQEKLDDAEDELQKIYLKYKKNGLIWVEIYKIPEARDAWHKYADNRHLLHDAVYYKEWKTRPWTSKEQQMYDKNVAFIKNHPDSPLYPRGRPSSN